MNETIITTSWDDGHSLDLKLRKLLKKYKIPATFYIPVKNIGRGREFKYLRGRKPLTFNQIKKIAKDFDIGGHTLNHTDLTKVSLKIAKKEILEGKKILENIIGREIISFSYPWGSYNQEIVELVKKCGFYGARTNHLFVRTMKDPFKMGTIIRAGMHSKRGYVFNFIRQLINSNDLKFSHFILKNRLFDKSWDQIAIKTLEFVIENGGIWHLWGHSWELEKNNGWKRLDAVFKRIKNIERTIKLVNTSELLRKRYLYVS